MAKSKIVPRTNPSTVLTSRFGPIHNGWFVSGRPYGSYDSRHRTKASAVRAARILARNTGSRVDVVRVENRGEDRYLAQEVFPDGLRRNPGRRKNRIGHKFDDCVRDVKRKGRKYGARDPYAICAASMRKKYGKKFQRLSAIGRHRAATARHSRGLVRSRKTGRLVKSRRWDKHQQRSVRRNARARRNPPRVSVNLPEGTRATVSIQRDGEWEKLSDKFRVIGGQLLDDDKQEPVDLVLSDIEAGGRSRGAGPITAVSVVKMSARKAANKRPSKKGIVKRRPVKRTAKAKARKGRRRNPSADTRARKVSNTMKGLRSQVSRHARSLGARGVDVRRHGSKQQFIVKDDEGQWHVLSPMGSLQELRGWYRNWWREGRL